MRRWPAITMVIAGLPLAALVGAIGPPKWKLLVLLVGHGLFAAGLLWLFYVDDRGVRRATGRCPTCGYDRQGSPGDCPECGAARAK